jgi:hypothetical protein
MKSFGVLAKSNFSSDCHYIWFLILRLTLQ